MKPNVLSCAARLPEPERGQFLAMLAEASATARAAWGMYYSVTGAKPRAKAKSQEQRAP